LLHSAATLEPQALVVTSKLFLKPFLEAADLSAAESRSLMLESTKLLAQLEMGTILKFMLGHKLSGFEIECIKVFLRDRDLRSPFLTNFGEILSNLDFPLQPKEQSELLTSGYFQAIAIIIETDELLGDTFGSIVSYILIWLSLLFSASSAMKLQRVADQLGACLESIFHKLGKGTHDPIEFSLSSYHTLYQSLGTLVNALMMVDQVKLLDFCKSCFVLLKSHVQTTVLMASLCLSRLLHRARSPTLLKKLRSAVALTFECCSDENCRAVSAVMNDIIDRAMISEFETDDVNRILEGAIRGVAFPGTDLANECVTFLCKLIILALNLSSSPLNRGCGRSCNSRNCRRSVSVPQWRSSRSTMPSNTSRTDSGSNGCSSQPPARMRRSPKRRAKFWRPFVTPMDCPRSSRP
jgi:hypothetical protein